MSRKGRALAFQLSSTCCSVCVNRRKQSYGYYVDNASADRNFAALIPGRDAHNAIKLDHPHAVGLLLKGVFVFRITC